MWLSGVVRVWCEVLRMPSVRRYMYVALGLVVPVPIVCSRVYPYAVKATHLAGAVGV